MTILETALVGRITNNIVGLIISLGDTVEQLACGK